MSTPQSEQKKQSIFEKFITCAVEYPRRTLCGLLSVIGLVAYSRYQSDLTNAPEFKLAALSQALQIKPSVTYDPDTKHAYTSNAEFVFPDKNGQPIKYYFIKLTDLETKFLGNLKHLGEPMLQVRNRVGLDGEVYRIANANTPSYLVVSSMPSGSHHASHLLADGSKVAVRVTANQIFKCAVEGSLADVINCDLPSRDLFIVNSQEN